MHRFTESELTVPRQLFRLFIHSTLVTRYSPTSLGTPIWDRVIVLSGFNHFFDCAIYPKSIYVLPACKCQEGGIVIQHQCAKKFRSWKQREGRVDWKKNKKMVGNFKTVMEGLAYVVAQVSECSWYAIPLIFNLLYWWHTANQEFLHQGPTIFFDCSSLFYVFFCEINLCSCL